MDRRGADGAWAAGVFAVAAAMLAMFAAPGMYFKDGGELAASAHVLGVAHPTGFPVFLLLGKMVDLLPAGGSFFRLNLLSVLAASAAAALAWFAALRLGSTARPRRIVALAGPACLLASHTVWLHATTTEVYALSMAGMGASVLAFCLAVVRRDARLFVAGWLLAGLGAGGHVTWAVHASAAGVVATAALWRPFAGRRVRVLGVAALAAAMAAMVVLYLPAAAARDPAMNWGDPSSADGMLAHLTGRRIRASFHSEIGGFRWVVLRAHVAEVISTFWDGTGPAWPLAAAGAFALAASSRWVLAILLVVVAGDLAFAAKVNPMGVHDLQTLVPATFGVAVLAGVGAVRLWAVARDHGRRVLAVGAAAVSVLAVGVQAASAPADRDMTRLFAPSETAAGVFDAAAPGTTVMTTSDDLSAGLEATQAVEAARPDMLVLVKQHLSDAAYVGRQVRAHHAWPADDAFLANVAARPFESGGETPVDAVARAVALAGARGPVRVEPGEAAVDRGLLESSSPAFPAFVSAGTGDMLPAAEDAVRQALRQVPGCDRWGREYVAGFVRLVASYVALSGHDVEALQILQAARAVSPDDPKTLNNLAVLLNAAGQRREAIDLLVRAVDLDPLYARGWRTLAGVARGLGLADVAADAEARLRELVE